MVQVSAVNLHRPSQLVQEGTLHGEGLNIGLTSIREHVHSRAATIYVAQSLSNVKQAQIALKSVFAPDVREPHDIRKEIKVLARMHHSNICQLLNAYFIDSHYILALPFCPRTLLDLLDDPTFIPAQDEEAAFTQVAKCLIKQMCNAVAYLESQQIAHRDISPSNFLLSDDGTAVLTDFGVAHDANEPGSERTNNLQFELGTGPYRAPELLFGARSYNPFALDRWSLGVVIASFFTAIGPRRPPTPESDDEHSSAPFSFMNITSKSTGPIERSTLFEGGFSDFALIGSIFKTLGTPTIETWPEAKDLPDFGKFNYRSFPPIDLTSVLPNLSQEDRERAVDLISGMLRYSYKDRLSGAQALKHPWLVDTVDNVKEIDLHSVKWFS